MPAARRWHSHLDPPRAACDPRPATASPSGSLSVWKPRHEPPGSDSPTLVRFLLTCDGCSYSHFDDKTVLVLSPSAAAFQLVGPDGSLTRQLTACATSALRLRVAAALHVHNAVSSARPLLLLSLLPPPEAAPAHSTSSEGADVRPPAALHHCTHRSVAGLVWSTDAAAAARGHAVAHADGSVRLFSVDRLGWLLLDPELASFEVCFPAAVSREAVDDPRELAPLGRLPPAASETCANAWHEHEPLWQPVPRQRSLFFHRTHSALGDLPAAWRHPLHIARCLSRRHAAQTRNGGEAMGGSPLAASPSPSAAAALAEHGDTSGLSGEAGGAPAGVIPRGCHGPRLGVLEGGESRLPVVVGGWSRRAGAPILNAQLLGGGVRAEACLRWATGGETAAGQGTPAALVQSNVAPVPAGCAEAVARVAGAGKGVTGLPPQTDVDRGVYIPLPTPAGPAASQVASGGSSLSIDGAAGDAMGALAMSALPPPERALEMIAAGATSGAVPQACAAVALLTPHAIFRAHPAAAILAACEEGDEAAAAEVAAWQVAEAWAGGGSTGDDGGDGGRRGAWGGEGGEADSAAAFENGSAAPSRLSVAVASTLAAAAAGDAAARGSRNFTSEAWGVPPPPATEAAFGLTMSLISTGEVVGLERAVDGGWVRLTSVPGEDATADGAGGAASCNLYYSRGCLPPTWRVAAGWGGDGIPVSVRYGALCAVGEGLWSHRLSVGRAWHAGGSGAAGRGGGAGCAALSAARSGLAQRGVGPSAPWEEIYFVTPASDAAGTAGAGRPAWLADTWGAHRAALESQGEQVSWAGAHGSLAGEQASQGVRPGGYTGEPGDPEREGAGPAANFAPHAVSPSSLPPSCAAPLSAVRGAGTSGGRRLSGDASETVEDVSLDAVGHFRRFGDGRVAAAFDDRTILTLAAPGTAAAEVGTGHSAWTAQRPSAARAAPMRWLTTAQEEWYVCRLVLPSGQTTTVRSDNPIGVGRYVAAAMEFLKWAERTPEERMAHEVRQRQQRCVCTTNRLRGGGGGEQLQQWCVFGKMRLGRWGKGYDCPVLACASPRPVRHRRRSPGPTPSLFPPSPTPPDPLDPGSLRHALETELRRIDRALFMGGAQQDRVAAAAAAGAGYAHGATPARPGDATADAAHGCGLVRMPEGQLGQLPGLVPGCTSAAGAAGGLGSLARVEAELRKLEEALHNKQHSETLGAGSTHQNRNGIAAGSTAEPEGRAASCAGAIVAGGPVQCASGRQSFGVIVAGRGGAVAGARIAAGGGELGVRFELERIRDFLERSA